MQLVETSSALRQIVAELAGAPRVYLDTEFESSRQGTQLCLIQLSVGGEVWLVDPLRVQDLGPLRELLEHDGCEWVFHAGAQDVQLLLDRAGIEAPPSLFDTQIAWALVGPEYSVSLVYLLFRVLGLRAPKTHQADDWKRRPLPATQLEYAAADVEHLPALYDALRSRLRELGREWVVAEATRELLGAAHEPPSTLSLRSFRNAWQLDAHGQAGFRFLIDWYNGLTLAEKQQAPEPKVLLSIANRMPQSGEALGRIKGVPRPFARRHGDALAGRLSRASAEAEADDFVPIDPPPYSTFDEIRIDGWLGVVRAETCVGARIAPELGLPGRLMKRWRAEVAEERSARPVLEGLSGWRREILAEHVARACARYPLELDG